MSTQMTEAMKSAKQIQTEMVQWENRNEVLKQENMRLHKENTALSEQIDAKRLEYSNYIASREKQYRDSMDKLSGDQRILDGQRDEFKSVLEAHQKEKMALEQEKNSLIREKSVLAGEKQMLNDFIQAVRRAYNVLPDSLTR